MHRVIHMKTLSLDLSLVHSVASTAILGEHMWTHVNTSVCCHCNYLWWQQLIGDLSYFNLLKFVQNCNGNGTIFTIFVPSVVDVTNGYHCTKWRCSHDDDILKTKKCRYRHSVNKVLSSYFGDNNKDFKVEDSTT